MPLLRRLFEPIRVGQVELKNRIVMLGMGTGLTNDEINECIYNYYIERAKGGASLIIIPASPTYKVAWGTLPGIHDDRMIPGLRWLADGIHKHGAKACLQLLILWRWASGPDAPVILPGPSEGMNLALREPMKPLSVQEIEQMVGEYGEGGRRAREAGFDMVEVHAGMGFLISRFLSSATNKRADQYGGSLENRLRFLLEIVHRIKERAGHDYALSVRFSGDEFMPGGHTLRDSQEVAKVLEANGVHLLNVQAGWEECPVEIAYMTVPRAAYVYQAEEIKKVVATPVVCAYRINDPLVAEDILAQGRADLIGLARALLADPYFPDKAKMGRLDDIRPCIACNHCLDVGFGPLVEAWGGKGGFECTVNPRLARETETELVPVPKAKKVLVIGGGPGGLEAARVAALRGHRVTLLESGVRLGGMVNTAMKPPGKQELGYLVNTMTKQARRAGVRVKLNSSFSPQRIIAARPDAVIVATGASPIILDIPGANRPNVTLATDVLESRYRTGESVVIVGGGLVGCETAEFLVEDGKKVTILEMLPRIGADIGLTVRWGVLNRLRRVGVRMETNAQVAEITDTGVKARRDGDKYDFFEADTVVLAVGMKANRQVAESLKGKVAELYLVGDCVEPRRITQAIREGYDVGMKV